MVIHARPALFVVTVMEFQKSSELNNDLLVRHERK